MAKQMKKKQPAQPNIFMALAVTAFIIIVALVLSSNQPVEENLPEMKQLEQIVMGDDFNNYRFIDYNVFYLEYLRSKEKYLNYGWFRTRGLLKQQLSPTPAGDMNYMLFSEDQAYVLPLKADADMLALEILDDENVIKDEKVHVDAVVSLKSFENRYYYLELKEDAEPMVRLVD